MLIKPLISEKTMKEAVKGRYSFVTKTSITKTDVKNIVEKLFGVNVIKIQTSIRSGKVYRSGRKMIFKRKSDWKKATVTVKDGQKIGIFEVPGSVNTEPQNEQTLKETGKQKEIVNGKNLNK